MCVCVCVCVCAGMCVCMCVCVGVRAGLEGEDIRRRDLLERRDRDARRRIATDPVAREEVVLQHPIQRVASLYKRLATQEVIGTTRPDENTSPGRWGGPSADVAAAPAWTRWRGSRRCSGA